MNIELSKLSESIASLSKEIKQSVADMPDSANKEMYNRIGDMMNHLHSYVSSVANQMYDYQDNHKKGHLPPIKSNSQMSKALKALGMEDDYTCASPKIVSTARKNDYIVEAEYIKSKE